MCILAHFSASHISPSFFLSTLFEEHKSDNSFDNIHVTVQQCGALCCCTVTCYPVLYAAIICNILAFYLCALHCIAWVPCSVNRAQKTNVEFM